MKLTLDQLVDRMGNVGHFRHTPPAARRQIVEGGAMREFCAGEVIFLQDDPSAGMFVLFQGKVRLSRLSTDGQEQIVTLIEPVIMFNEVTVLDGNPNPVTAIAEEDCVTWNVSYDAFQSLLHSFPEVGLGLLRVLAARNRVLVELCADLSFRPVLARLAKLLLALSHQGMEVIDRGENPIQTMAARIATVPEAISRSLTMLREQAALEVSRTHIRVLRPDILIELAQLDDAVKEGKTVAHRTSGQQQ